MIAEVFSGSLCSESNAAAEIDELVWFDPKNRDDLKIAPLSRLILDQIDQMPHWHNGVSLRSNPAFAGTVQPISKTLRTISGSRAITFK